jgi:large subunit ribosomal protein L17
MKKKVFGRKLSRSRPAREALFASLMRAMILGGKLKTTRAKAKAVLPDLEKLVTLAKKADLNSKRRILGALDNKRDAFDILLQKVAPAFSARISGFTRIISTPSRKGDNAQMVRVEWTEKIENSEKKPEASKGTEKKAARKGKSDKKAGKSDS